MTGVNLDAARRLAQGAMSSVDKMYVAATRDLAEVVIQLVDEIETQPPPVAPEPSTAATAGPRPRLRLRCPFDAAGDYRHNALDLSGPVGAGKLASLIRALGDCRCGKALIALNAADPEPWVNHASYQINRDAQLRTKKRR